MKTAGLTMDTQAVEAANTGRDKAMYAVSALLFVAGLFAFSYFDPKWPLIARAAILIVATAAALAASYRTELGRGVIDAVMGSRTELRKVVWPTKQESVQTALMIAVVVLIMSLFIWGLDAALLYGVEKLTGRN